MYDKQIVIAGTPVPYHWYDPYLLAGALGAIAIWAYFSGVSSLGAGAPFIGMITLIVGWTGHTVIRRLDRQRTNLQPVPAHLGQKRVLNQVGDGK